MNVSDDAISAVYNTQGSISIPAPLCAPLSSHFLLFDFSGVLARDAFVARCQIISNPYISSTLGEYATSQQRLPFPFFFLLFFGRAPIRPTVTPLEANEKN